MGAGLEHTVRTLVESDVDFGPVRARWQDYLEARSKGYTSPWARLLDTLLAEPLDRSAVRAAGLGVARSRLTMRRRIRASLAVVAPRLAARWVGQKNP